MLIYTKTYIDKDTERTVNDTKHCQTLEEQAERVQKIFYEHMDLYRRVKE